MFACEQARRQPGPAVPVEGPDRRLPADGGGAGDAGDLRRLPRRLARDAPSCIRTATPATRSACAAALASLAIFDSDDVLARNRGTAARMAALAAPLRRPSARGRRAPGRHDRRVRADRAIGDTRTPLRSGAAHRPARLPAALERGVVLRPLGDVLYWMPPYCIDEDGAAAARATTTRETAHRGGQPHAPDPRPRRSAAAPAARRSRCPKPPPRTWCACCAWASGDACVLFNGDGHDYAARIAALGKREAARARSIRRARGRQRIAAADHAAAGHRPRREDGPDPAEGDRTRRRADRIRCGRERSEVKLDAERADKRLAHWRSVVASACEQSGRARVPDGAARRSRWPRCSRALRRRRTAPDPGSRRASCRSPRLPIEPRAACAARDRPGRRLVGARPRALRAAGFQGLRLGPRILRTETAGLAAIAALQAGFGDFR